MTGHTTGRRFDALIDCRSIQLHEAVLVNIRSTTVAVATTSDGFF